MNLIVPQLGNLYRSYHLKEVYKVPYTHYISSYFSFLWMDTILNMLVAAVLVAVMNPTLMIGQFNASLLLTTITLLIFSIPFVCLGFCKLSSVLLNKSLWIQSKIHEVFSVTIENLKDPKYMFQVLLLGLLQLPVVCILYLLYFRCFHIDAGIPTILLFYSLYRVSLYLNITPGNLGVREVAFGILSDLMQIGKPEGILISTISRIFNYIIIIGVAIPMGGFSLLKNVKQLAPKQDQ
ncbi:MAG: lysylphosphatidylglycerol synthase domain-containing protein [Planctomycetota bacterium]